MKGFKFIFAVCLAPIVFYSALANTGATLSRTGVRRDVAQPSARDNKTTTSRAGQTSSRTRAATVSQRGATTTRTATNTGRSTSVRSGTTPRQSVVTVRNAVKTNISRAATDATAISNILNKNYSKCKTVFNECMDEFCANKDTQLRRCACSARTHEFDNTKRQLSNAEDKLLDFNQRLLVVNLDKEDAAAITKATAGEEAFYESDDKSASKKTLDSIAKKLKDRFADSEYSGISNNLSWSLNADSAFDSIDSLAGASTVSKSGTALYSAALPICREMSREVCSDSELSIAENGYQLLIEQDCNTVEKTYKTQIEQTRGKILDSSALLDMSRLDTYQTRNSDDILTCKTKMLDILATPSVCGSGLEKCLDTTGRYIDPSTGQAFLTTDLTQLNNLITAPTGNQTWSELNETFVSFLNSKKKYIEPATANCQNIADDVWKMFIEDAISQIKIAQTTKLEDIRQSCTTLTSQCMSDAMQSIQDFDSRALSIFGISATQTAQTMCSNVVESCKLVMDSTGSTSEYKWSSGADEIMLMDLYSQIMSTCREVGRNCIIQQCKSISGNFGLCEDTEFSINRKSILNRYACWNEVYDCVKSAGEKNINDIFGKFKNNIQYDSEQRFYATLYGSTRPGDDICIDANDKICLLTERIWGNCEHQPTYIGASNKILIPRDDETTLLYWFAQNTGTINNPGACKDNTCPQGQYPVLTNNNYIQCLSNEYFFKCSQPDAINAFCGRDDEFKIFVDETKEQHNCCGDIENTDVGGKDWNGNCCTGHGIAPNSSHFTTWNPTTPTGNNKQVCVPSTTTNTTYVVGSGDTHLFCTGNVSDDKEDPTKVICNGTYILVKDGVYYTNIKDITTPTEKTNYWYDDCTLKNVEPNSKPYNWIIDLK